MPDLLPLTDESEVTRRLSREGEAILFNAGVRALGSHGLSIVEFDIGGKKSRRRYVVARSPSGEAYSVWIKSTLLWVGMADVVRFPWSKRSIQSDDMQASMHAVDDAIRRGCTHLLPIVGNELSGRLNVARLYRLDEIKQVVIKQRVACQNPFFVAHGATLIVRAHHDDFRDAEAVAHAFGEDVLAPLPALWVNAEPARVRSGPTYPRNAKVREKVLKLADGYCERCGQQGFLTKDGDRYLETHHVVGVAERGPDTVDNIVAVCPSCHRQAHFAANFVEVERDLMRAIRDRGSKTKGNG